MSYTDSANSAPPGFLAMLGDKLGVPGMLTGGSALYGAGKLAATKIPGLLARYGASAGGSMAAAPVTALASGLYGLGDGKGNVTTSLNDGEVPLYIKDPASGQWVPNPANPQAQSQALLKQSMTPDTAATPQTPTPTVAAPIQAAMASQAAAPAPMPQPRPAMPNPTPPPAAPTSLASPAPGPTAPPTGLYNGPGSQNYGMGGVTGTPASGGIQNGANITSALQKLLGGNASAIGQPQTPQMAQSNPMGNILPFIKNLLAGGSSFGSDSSDPGKMGSLY